MPIDAKNHLDIKRILRFSFRSLAILMHIWLSLGVSLTLAALPDPGEPPMHANRPVIAEVFTLPTVLESASIRSVGHYILLRHLVRPFLEYRNDGQLSGDLMKSWSINSEHTRYSFELADDALWSDGSPITCEQIAGHLDRLKKARSSIHFDFDSIDRIKCHGSKKIEITLHKPNVLFLSQVTEPEFGPVWPNSKSSAFNITSGPYVVKQAIPEKEFWLTRRSNPYRGIDPKSPSELLIKSSEVEIQIRDFKIGKSQFLAPRSSLNQQQHRELMSVPGAHGLKPRIGFTYWLSLRPDSELLRNIATRKAIQALFARSDLAPNNPLPTWSAAHQLYLEDGPGRPSQAELREWQGRLPGVDQIKGLRLKVLLDKTFPFNNEILERLAAAGVKAEAAFYTGQDEFVGRMKEGAFDAFLINNDFAAVDLLENLTVTFNPARPLIYVEKGDDSVSKKLSHARTLLDDAERHPIYKDIGMHVLDRGLIVPLMYRTTWFYYSEHLDLSAWSQLFFEVSFWKARVR